MERIGEEQKMTTKEVAEALGVTERSVRRHAQKLGITRNGVNTLITEKQATDIKNSIAKSGRNDLDNVVQLENVSTESEENEIVMQALAILKRKSDEYKRRAEIAETKCIELQPKAKNWDDIASHETFMNFRDAAGKMGLPQKDLMTLLKTKYIYKNTRGEYRAFSEYQHLFSLRPYTNGDFLGSQLMLTADGYLYFNKKVNG